MVTKTFIENILKEYFIEKRGCKTIFLTEFDSKFVDALKYVDLIFRDAKNLIFIKIFHTNFIGSYVELKNSIRKVILSLTKFSKIADKIYLAVYKDNRLFAVTRSDLFYDSGIGLLIIDESGNVEEKIPSTLYDLLPGHNKQISSKDEINNLEKKVSDIYIMIKDLERNVNIINDELNKVKIKLRKMEEKLIKKPKRTETNIIINEEKETLQEDLEGFPEFIRNNPWINVLRKRYEKS